MRLLADSDTTTLSYWLTWRVLLCALWVLTPLVLGSYLIWKYEHFESDGDGERASNETYYNQSWKPCLKGIHPIFFMSFRIISFCLLLVALSFDVAVHAFVSIWCPYPFLDLSKPRAPFWYLVVALRHLPCYGIFLLIVKLCLHLPPHDTVGPTFF